MGSNDEKEILDFTDQESWHRWLADNGDTSQGVWLQLRRKGSTIPGISYATALETALCFGWIDGQAKSLDADSTLRVFTPRRSRSIWSQVNRKHIERLTAEGRMQPAGIAQVEAAKGDGRWDAAYAPPSERDLPEDLAAALAASPAASAFFETLSSQNRFAIVFRVGNVKRAETRAAKIAGFVEMLERGETVHPQKPRG